MKTFISLWSQTAQYMKRAKAKLKAKAKAKAKTKTNLSYFTLILLSSSKLTQMITLLLTNHLSAVANCLSVVVDHLSAVAAAATVQQPPPLSFPSLPSDPCH